MAEIQGHNFGSVVAESMNAIDAHHTFKTQKMVEEEQKISHRLDCLMSCLTHCYNQMRDPNSTEPVNLEAIRAELEDLSRFYREQGLDPTEGFGPIDDLVDHLHAVDKADVESLTRVLESKKRSEQNRMPMMMGDFQLMMQLYNALVEMHRAMEETHEKGDAYIVRKMGS